MLLRYINRHCIRGICRSIVNSQLEYKMSLSLLFLLVTSFCYCIGIASGATPVDTPSSSPLPVVDCNKFSTSSSRGGSISPLLVAIATKQGDVIGPETAPDQLKSEPKSKSFSSSTSSSTLLPVQKRNGSFQPLDENKVSFQIVLHCMLLK